MLSGPHSDVAAIADKALGLFQSEQPEAAMELVLKGLQKFNHARLYRVKARLLLLQGAEEEAADILRSILAHIWGVRFWEIALSGAQCSYALTSDQHKLAYFPVRKCSSTSLHNAMAVLRGGALKGEDIHEGVEQYQLLNRESWTAELQDYFSFLVVRDPVERVRSFYYGNIIGRDHLVVDTGGKESFYGLPTKPSYSEFLDRFHEYRRTFVTVRNHTDALVSYVGDDASVFDWKGPTRHTQELLDILSERTAISFPALHEMQTGAAGVKSHSAEAHLHDFYARDYEAFGRYF